MRQSRTTAWGIAGWVVTTLCAGFAHAADPVTTGPSTQPTTGPTVQAPEPILEGHTADPGFRVFGDKYYLYPTSDKPNWLTTDFSAWSSPDLVHWTKERMVLDVTKELSWAKLRAWAPDTIERDGKYYFYFCADTKIGVAVGDNPAGPFKDAIGKPLIEKTPAIKGQTIDPFPFIDDDGQAYLYFGNSSGFAYAAKLKPDMITLDGDPIEVPVKQFHEGIDVFKRKGVYYFMWSVDDARSPNYRLMYGTSKSALGPVETHSEVVLKKNGPVIGTGHHGVVNVPGTDRWYVAYHRHAIPGGNGYIRQVCLAKMEFNDDGSIKPMDPLVPAFTSGDVGEPLTNGRGKPDAK